VAFWSDGKSSPKLSYQWNVTINNDSGGHLINSWLLRSFQKPSLEVAVSEYMNINDIGYKPGTISWKPIQISAIDGQDKMENTTQSLYQALKGAGYFKKSTAILGPSTAIIKADASKAIGGLLVFSQIDDEGEVLETWTLWNPFISQVNFGQANYTSDELMIVNFTIQYDFAIYSLE
jgi:hypothetical protein